MTSTNLNDIPLDLNDPAVVAAVKAADVSNIKETQEDTKPVAEKIKELQKNASFTMKLTAPQVAKLMREADSLGMTWRKYLEQQVQEHILSKGIGAATITSPTFGRKKVVAPSSWLNTDG